MVLASLFLIASLRVAETPGRIDTRQIGKNVLRMAEPCAARWKETCPIIVGNDRYAKPALGHRTAIHNLWSNQFLHVLYTCSYKNLHVNPDPTKRSEAEKW